MSTYRGGCHCGAVRFEAEAELKLATACNCSICTKKGIIHHRVKAFRLTSGESLLTLYQFGEMKAKHWFCSRCGIHPFSNPRAAPDQTSINLRCLDDFEVLRGQIAVQDFDGRHWENNFG